LVALWGLKVVGLTDFEKVGLKGFATVFLMVIGMVSELDSQQVEQKVSEKVFAKVGCLVDKMDH
jgi:hypothetical protein